MFGQKQGRLIISVDLDMWWHCRWATGSRGALWRDTSALFRDYYGSSKPDEEVQVYTERVLQILDDFDIKATFFVLGEMASYFPDLIRRVHGCGHEIACHGWHHVDASDLGRECFREEVGRAKALLENLTGEPALGYRAPNLVLTPWLFEEIVAMGFVYDSSVCPCRKLFGKNQNLERVPWNPFLMPIDKNLESSEFLVEIPIPSMPVVKLPGCSGIASRVFGSWWTELVILNAQRSGDVMYFFHPYEIGQRPHLINESFYIRVFLRRIGKPYERILRRILGRAKGSGNVLARDAVYELLANQVDYDKDPQHIRSR